MLKTFARRASAACLAGACLLGTAAAQSPQALKLVVPFPAGGTADILPRVVAEKLRPQLPRRRDGRQPHRRGRQHRRRAGVPRRARRQHPAGLAAGADRDQPASLQEALLRPDEMGAGHGAGDGAQRAGGEPQAAGEERAGVHRLRQGQPRQGDLRLAGQRHHLAPDGQHVHAADRHRHGPRALQGHGARAGGPGGRAGRRVLRQPQLLVAASTRPASCASWPWPTGSARTPCPTCPPSPSRGCPP